MRAGAYDRRITIKRNEIVGDDGYGNVVYEVVDVATLWAQVQQQSGKEFFAQAGIQSDHLMIFRTRWINGVTTDDKVAYQDDSYEIHEVRELGRRDGLELHASLMPLG